MSFMLLSGCMKDASDIFIIAEPSLVTFSDLYVEGKLVSSSEGFPAASAASFEITASSIHAPLAELKAEVFYAGAGETKVFYTKELSTREYIGDIAFKTPAVKDVTPFKFTFTATDEEGYVGITRVVVDVFPTVSSVVEELAAVTLFTSTADGFDGFSFQSRQPLYSGENEELSDMVFSDDGEGNVRLSSLNGTLFVRAPSFDYPAATADAISSVFKASLRQTSVSDVSNDDIILVGISEEGSAPKAYGAFKVLAISGNRIVLSIKVLD